MLCSEHTHKKGNLERKKISVIQNGLVFSMGVILMSWKGVLIEN
jgi:hypothetical protein